MDSIEPALDRNTPVILLLIPAAKEQRILIGEGCFLIALLSVETGEVKPSLSSEGICVIATKKHGKKRSLILNHLSKQISKEVQRYQNSVFLGVQSTIFVYFLQLLGELLHRFMGTRQH